MELRVKQRLVGASILGVLIVLIVPELLSGPAPPPAPKAAASAPEPVRTVTVDLATAKAPVADPVPEPAPAPSAPPASAQPDTVPPAAAPTPTAPRQAAPRQAARLETSAPPPTYSAAAVKPANAGRGWTVQLGSFQSHDNADKLQRQLKAQGFSAVVSPSGTGTSLRYRVRIGPLADRGAAALEVEKLKSSGHASSLVPPGP